MNVKFERRAHPRGEAGTRISLEEAAKRAAEGRLDPRVRAWAIEKLVQGGNPKTIPGKATVLLEALRRERIYVPDPVDAEFIPSAACTLEGCYGLVFLGEDCDGLLVSFLAACLSVGIDGAVVGHGYPDLPDKSGQLTGFSGQLSHVLGAIHDSKTNEWLLADPSTNQPLGTAHGPRRERWIHAVSGRVLCDTTSGVCQKDGFVDDIQANISPQGTFIGVGAPAGQLGASAFFLRVPAGQIGAPATQLDPAELIGLEDSQAQSIMASQVRDMTSIVRESLSRMMQGHREMQIIREEYLNRPISDPNVTSPPLLGFWTQAEETYYQKLVLFSKQLIQYGDEAGSGTRPVAWDTNKNEIVIIGAPGEPALSITPNGDMSISDLPGDEWIAPVPSVYGGTVGWGPVTVGILIAMVAIGTYVIVDRVYTSIDKRTEYARKTDLTTFHEQVFRDTGSVEQADKSTAAVADAAAQKAKAEADREREANRPFEALLNIAEGAAYAGLTIGALYLGGKLLLEVLPYFFKPKPARAS